jgi:hypothetical protein
MATAYIYSLETREIAEELTDVENYGDCEEEYSNYDEERFGITFTPAFGTTDGLVWPEESDEVKFFGTEEESIIKTPKGIFLIQSPDMAVGFGYEELDEIPEGFQELNPSLFCSFEIPKEIL